MGLEDTNMASLVFKDMVGRGKSNLEKYRTRLSKTDRP